MVCIYCGQNTRVTNSRLQKRSNNVWRRRQCSSCQAVFTTHESVELSGALLVNNGSLSPFESNKLLVELLEALKHHPQQRQAATEISHTIVMNLLKRRQKVLTTKLISQETAAVLKRFDKRAWLRYCADHPSATS